MRFRSFLIQTICSLWVISVVAIPQTHALELEEYIADVVAAHPLVREQVHIFRQSQQEQSIAKSGWRPSVDLLATASKVEGDSPTVVGSQGTQSTDFNSDLIELSVTQNLFNGFDTTNSIKQTDARMRSALYQLYDTADNVALDAVQAYLDVLRQQRLLELAKENVVSHEETLKKIRRRSNSGAGRRSQLEQTTGRVARARASYVAQQNNLEDALTRAHELLGRYVSVAELKPPTKLQSHPGLDLDKLIDKALILHPALKVANYNIESALYDQYRARSTRYPTVDLRLAKEIGNDLNGIPGETDETSLTLNFQYNFYRGGADRAERRRRTSAVAEQQQFAARVRRQVINTLRLAWMADQSLTQQIIFLKQHVDQSEKTALSYREEFFIGQRDLIDLLDAKNELNSAQNRYTEALYESFAARYRILEGIGRLFQSLDLKVELEDDNLRIGRIEAQGEDTLPLNPDIDNDKETDLFDHCDNSVANSKVNEYGCLAGPLVDKPVVKTEAPVVTGNRAPIANDDQLDIEQNGVVLLDRGLLLKNDTDADGDALVIESFTQPVSGKLALNSKRDLVYRAAEGFIGEDKFTYIVTDGKDGSASATVSVNVLEVSDISLSKIQYVNFEYNKSDLTPGSKDKVQHIVNKLKLNPEVTISIYAYTDSLGSESYNLALSERRANATRQLLISEGIDAARIRAIGGGEDNPIADNLTKIGQAINRRGEFHFNTWTQ